MLGEGLFGPRYYLAGKPVYDGSPLAVRTLKGWLEGMFVWSGWPQDRPKLVFMGQTHVPITLEPATDLRWEL